MRVKRDFGQIYAAEDDPWAIGEADSERYELYRRIVLEQSERRGTILDIGCGFGAFLARFEEDFEELIGVEVSAALGSRERVEVKGTVDGQTLLKNLPVKLAQTNRTSTISNRSGLRSVGEQLTTAE